MPTTEMITVQYVAQYAAHIMRKLSLTGGYYWGSFFSHLSLPVIARETGTALLSSCFR